MKNVFKTVVICGIGSILEWYDFSLFGTLASAIAKNFFYSKNGSEALFLVFATFATGFLLRPLGGVFFGHIGDRAGRKKALSMTIIFMALSTTLIGIIPTYQKIGIIAPTLVILMRLLQGISVSGEYPSAIALMVELAPPSKKGLISSFSIFGTVAGILLGSIVVTITTKLLTNNEFYSWGWRIPFLLSFPLGVLGLYLRYKIQESSVFQTLLISNNIKKTPVIDVIKQKPKELIGGLGIFILSNVSFYTVFVYLNTYIASTEHHLLQNVLLINTANMLFLVILIPFFGALSDRYNKYHIMFFGAAGIFILTYPLFVIIDNGGIIAFLFAQTTFALFHAMFIGPIAICLAELFPSNIRVSGLSLILNIAASIFGGTAPLIATYLIHLTKMPIAASYYLVFCAMVAVVSAIYLKHLHKVNEERIEAYEIS